MIRKIINIWIFVLFFQPLFSQTDPEDVPGQSVRKFITGFNAGIAYSYTDRSNIFSASSSFSLDMRLGSGYYLQFAPRYSWLMKWNEHYLTLPVHLRKSLSGSFSIFAGPAISFDLGFFRSFGASAGLYYHFSEKSSLLLSAFTFDLYSYNIDYLYIPVIFSYNYNF